MHSAEAPKDIAKYWDGLCLFLDDGRIELGSNAVERTIRAIVLNRQNALFAGHDAGGAKLGRHRVPDRNLQTQQD